MSSARRWSDINPSPAVDAAMRRAAAERVMGWTSCGKGTWKITTQGELLQKSDWLPDQNRDDLARVFVAALETMRKADLRSGEKRGNPLVLVVTEEWQTALADPRAALAALLDLLNIEPPEGLDE